MIKKNTLFNVETLSSDVVYIDNIKKDLMEGFWKFYKRVSGSISYDMYSSSEINMDDILIKPYLLKKIVFKYEDDGRVIKLDNMIGWLADESISNKNELLEELKRQRHFSENQKIHAYTPTIEFIRYKSDILSDIAMFDEKLLNKLTFIPKIDWGKKEFDENVINEIIEKGLDLIPVNKDESYPRWVLEKHYDVLMAKYNEMEYILSELAKYKKQIIADNAKSADDIEYILESTDSFVQCIVDAFIDILRNINLEKIISEKIEKREVDSRK